MRKFTKVVGCEISAGAMVRVKKMNHLVEVQYLKNEGGGLQKIKKLDQNTYLNLDDGEIKEYLHSINRSQNVAGLKDSFKKLRDLINNNYVGSGNELHVTLSYADHMTDTKKLYSDFKSFWKRLIRKYGDLEYLTVIEPQGDGKKFGNEWHSGTWHMHLLLKSSNKLFIPVKDLENIWGHGFVFVRSLKDVDNIGAYLSAYLGDVEMNDENVKMAIENKMEIKIVDFDGKSKKFIKGGRLHLYPPGTNLFRHSKGVVPPEVVKMRYKDIKKIVGSAKANYSQTITIEDSDENKILNKICYENYNIKRLKS